MDSENVKNLLSAFIETLDGIEKVLAKEKLSSDDKFKLSFLMYIGKMLSEYCKNKNDYCDDNVKEGLKKFKELCETYPNICNEIVNSTKNKNKSKSVPVPVNPTKPERDRRASAQEKRDLEKNSNYAPQEQQNELFDEFKDSMITFIPSDNSARMVGNGLNSMKKIINISEGIHLRSDDSKFENNFAKYLADINNTLISKSYRDKLLDLYSKTYETELTKVCTGKQTDLNIATNFNSKVQTFKDIEDVEFVKLSDSVTGYNNSSKQLQSCKEGDKFKFYMDEILSHYKNYGNLNKPFEALKALENYVNLQPKPKSAGYTDKKVTKRNTSV
jgi:hypothetical protein